MTRLVLLCLAIALGLAGWGAILELPWWVAGALVYLYLLALAAVACVGGFTAALRWLLERQRRSR